MKLGESASRPDGWTHLKVVEREIEDAANELDQMFRQRHKHDDVIHRLKKLVNLCAAPVSERGSISVPKKLLDETITALYRKDNIDSHSLAAELEGLK